MKLTGELEKKVNEAADKAEAKKLIEQAGMILTDDELEKVAGGVEPTYVNDYEPCPKGGEHKFTSDASVYEKFNITKLPGLKICEKCGGCITVIINPW